MYIFQIGVQAWVERGTGVPNVGFFPVLSRILLLCRLQQLCPEGDPEAEDLVKIVVLEGALGNHLISVQYCVLD